MKEHQTPRKDLLNRRLKDSASASPSSKSISDQLKKPQKIAKKSLNAEFSSVSEDLLTESLLDSFTFTPISDALTDNPNGESLDSLECSVTAEKNSPSTSEEPLTPSDSTSTITSVNVESIDRSKEFVSNGLVEAEAVVVGNLLKQARVQVLNSTDIHPRSKKLLDALVEVSVKEFYALPVERDQIDVLISERIRVLVICFMVMMMISVIIIVFGRGSGAESSYSYFPRPT